MDLDGPVRVIAATRPRSAITRRDVLRLGGAVGVLGALAACGADPSSTSTPSSSTTTPVPTVTLDDAARATLDGIATSVFTRSGLAGMAAAVWIGDQTWQSTRGVADLTTQAPYRAADHVRIASITKSFTGTAILQMVDAGRLQLTDVLERYVPGIAYGDTITVKQLLGMQSGVYDFTGNAEFLTSFNADPTMAWSTDQTVALIKANQPAFAPGGQLQYCDSNFVLLGMILEKVGGQTVDRVITDQVITRLDLPGTSYPTDAAMPDPHPTAYFPGGDTTDGSKPFDNAAHPPRVADEVNPVVSGGAGAMISTLSDLRVWGRELASGSLLTPQTQALRLQSTRFPDAQINVGYGLGCEVFNDFVGHNGAIIGYSTVVMSNPKADVTIAAVANESTNFSTPTSDFAYGVIKELYPDQWK